MKFQEESVLAVAICELASLTADSTASALTAPATSASLESGDDAPDDQPSTAKFANPTVRFIRCLIILPFCKYKK